MALRPARRCCWRARAKRPKSRAVAALAPLEALRHLDRAELHVGHPRRRRRLPGGGARRRPAAARHRRLARGLGALAGRVGGRGHAFDGLGAGHDAPRVEHAAGPLDGRPHGRPIARELLEEPETVPDEEDGEQEIRPVLGLDEIQRRVAGEDPALLVEGVEDERHERGVTHHLRRRGRGGGAGRGRSLRRAHDEAEAHDRLGLALLEDLDFLGRRSLTVRPFLSRATMSSTTAWAPVE